MKDAVSKVTGNPIGAIAGGVLAYYVGKKMIQNNLLLIGATIVGVYIGAMVQSGVKAKSSVPTASVVK